jgi:hypothetical protein
VYARLVTSQFLPGTMDERIRINRDSIVPLAKQQEGFQGALLLVDRNTGKSVVITLWDTEASMLAAAPSSYLPESTRQEVTALLVAGAPYIALYHGALRGCGADVNRARFRCEREEPSRIARLSGDRGVQTARERRQR